MPYSYIVPHIQRSVTKYRFMSFKITIQSYLMLVGACLNGATQVTVIEKNRFTIKTALMNHLRFATSLRSQKAAEDLKVITSLGFGYIMRILID